jgi:hypothetical protein
MKKGDFPRCLQMLTTNGQKGQCKNRSCAKFVKILINGKLTITPISCNLHLDAAAAMIDRDQMVEL